MKKEIGRLFKWETVKYVNSSAWNLFRNFYLATALCQVLNQKLGTLWSLMCKFSFPALIAIGCFSFRTFICFYLYHISLTWVCFPPKYVPGIGSKSFLPFDLEWLMLTKHTVLAVLCTCLLYTTDFSSGQRYITVSILKWINCPQAVLSCSQWQVIQFLYFLHYSASHIILLYFGHTCLNKDRKADIKFFTFLPFQQSGQR